jgi:transcriptional regulator with XRE-family HTH domain
MARLGVGPTRLYERTAAPASVRVNGVHLRREMARRGWRAIDLARAAGVSAGTMTAVMKGTYVSPRTLQKIAAALTKAPVVPGLDDLLEASSRADAS